MTFCEALNLYITEFEISSKELAAVSGLSPATISRFRNGDRTPAAGSEALADLLDALILLGKSKGFDPIREEVSEKLSANLRTSDEDKRKFRDNLNSLISALSISVAALAKGINYDASLISRIRTGKRQPTDVKKLGGEIATYVAVKFADDASKAIVADLIPCKIQALSITENYRDELLKWLINNEKVSEDSSLKFLKSLNDFNLDEYIKAIHFDEFKVPSVPFQLPASKTYTGIDGFKQAELDWLKATVLSKSMESVIMYSDMPMEEMAKDLEFGKKWMFGMALMLKKGLHIHQIHNLDRSFTDMMLGLESWIPLYMTGQISPYYFRSINNTVFMNFFRVSGNAACSGEAICGYYNDGRYSFSKGNDDVKYYRKRGEALLSKATPLMNIYNKANAVSLGIFWDKETEALGNRRNVLSALPLYTMSEALLERILVRNQIPTTDISAIKEHLARQKKLLLTVLSHSSVCDEIPVLSEESFNEHTMSLSLSDMFYTKDIRYTYTEYLEHLGQTRAFSAENENYSIAENDTPVFWNIQIHIFEKKWVMVSKNKAPTIHFVIRHPRLRESIENMVIPIVE